MKNKHFSLTESAFHILKADYSSSRSDLAELVEDAEFDEQFDPETIHSAQQSLLAPMARLEEELSWLPELSHVQISNVIGLISSGDVVGLKQFSEHLPELAKANVLAHLIGTKSVAGDIFHLLVAAWEEIDINNIFEVFNDDRSVASFPKIELKQLANTLQNLEKLHASTAAAGIWSLDRPGQAMDQIVETELKMHPSSSFLDRFVRSYDNLSEPNLVRISNEIDGYIELAQEDTASLGAMVSAISDRLAKWDDINQPVQVYEQHQGHEEGRSKKIYEKLRSLCLELANDRSEFSEAHRLSEALLRTFPELESVAEVLKGDVAQLKELDEQQQQQRKFQPLIEACEAAKKTGFPMLKATLAESGFTSSGNNPVSEIFAALKAATLSKSDVSVSYMIVRDLALYVNNERNDPQSSFLLIEGLLAYPGLKPSNDLVKKLKDERAVLHQNWKQKELENNSGNTKAMLLVVNDLLKFSQGSERRKFGILKAKLVMRRTSEIIKMGVIIAAATAFAGVLIYQAMDKPSSRATYQPSTPRAATPRAATPRPTTTAVQETMPPVGQGLALDGSQVRYCVFQGQRLDSIRPLTNTNYQVDQFNRLIKDFNSRCSNYRYTAGMLSSIQREAANKAGVLQAEARRIVASW